MHQATFRMDLVGQGHLLVPEGCVRTIKPGKKPGQSLVTFRQAQQHGGVTKRRRRHVNGDGTSTVPVHGDAETLRGKLAALRGAGSETTKEETKMNATPMREPWDMPYRKDRARAAALGMSVSEYRQHMKQEQIRKKQEETKSRQAPMEVIPKTVLVAKREAEPMPTPEEVDKALAAALAEEPTAEERLAEAKAEVTAAQEMLEQAKADLAALEAVLEAEREAAKEDARRLRLIELLQAGTGIEEALAQVQ